MPIYRLSSLDEIYELGLDAAFEEDICLVEWPERLGSLRLDHAITLTLTIVEETQRRVSLEWSDPKWNSMITLLQHLNLPPG